MDNLFNFDDNFLEHGWTYLDTSDSLFQYYDHKYAPYSTSESYLATPNDWLDTILYIKSLPEVKYKCNELSEE